jgi:hypothetical protein
MLGTTEDTDYTEWDRGCRFWRVSGFEGRGLLWSLGWPVSMGRSRRSARDFLFGNL